MKGGKSPLKPKAQNKGYTIVEVMIVLAVSGFMLVIAASFINGKQASASFSQGVNETASRVQGTIDQVTDGRFSDIRLTCQLDGATTIKVNATSDEKQGRNAPCVFLGKFMHFSLGGKSDQYETFLLAGKRDSTNLATAGVKPVIGADIDLTVASTVPQGLSIRSLKVNGSPSWGIGFVRDPVDGKRVTPVHAPSLTNPSLNQSGAAATITSLEEFNTAVFCLTDDKRFATITIGSDGGKLRTDTQLGLKACPA